MSRVRGAAGAELVELATRVADGARLARGRSVERRGLVGELTVEPGAVTAEVTGSRPLPYEVTVACRLAPGGIAGELESVAAGDALAARLLARGTVPPGLVDVAVAAGVGLVPGPVEVSFSCTCPDWGEPCKHAVAVLLAFARLVDDDGPRLLRWRGLDSPAPSAPERAGPATVTDLLARLPGRVRRGLPTEPPGSPPHTAADPAPPSPDPALDAFLSGRMPSAGPVFAEVRLGGSPGRGAVLPAGGAFLVDGVDAAPVFADALTVVAESLESLS